MKWYVLKDWTPAGVHYWKIVETLGSGALLEEVSHWESAHDRCNRTLALLLSSSSLIPGCYKVSSFAPTLAPSHDILPHHNPETMESSGHGLKPQTKINLSFFYVISGILSQ
jgi:hypothetical protein